MIRSGFITIASLTIAACATPQVEQRGKRPPVLLQQKAIGGASASAPAFDDVAWDKFQHRTMVIRRCRRVSSGETIPDSFCHGKSKNDLQWPGMAVPANYKGLLLE
jgi:hypothetical protein